MSSQNGFFSVLEIHREDLREAGFDFTEISDRQMALLATYIGEYFVETGLFWKVLRMYARKMELPVISPAHLAGQKG